jgi:hypothetical protein
MLAFNGRPQHPILQEAGKHTPITITVHGLQLAN